MRPHDAAHEEVTGTVKAKEEAQRPAWKLLAMQDPHFKEPGIAAQACKLPLNRGSHLVLT